MCLTNMREAAFKMIKFGKEKGCTVIVSSLEPKVRKPVLKENISGVGITIPVLSGKHMKDSFDLVSLEGLCCLVPPSYLQGFAQKYPKTYKRLVRKENQWKARWPWKIIGDYYIITLRKK